jgi:hypothetical protein
MEVRNGYGTSAFFAVLFRSLQIGAKFFSSNITFGFFFDVCHAGV